MSEIREDQIESWLKKLERESWQLELLVSAFTIFLLIGANAEFDTFLAGLRYEYNISGPILSIGYVFLILIQKSISALTICLVVHLMLRGFWIGAIGLRSVQSNIDFSKLNYNDFFTEKLKKKVISLDRMVILLDEICSVIFAFSFLIISVLLAFGMFLAFLAVSGVALSSLIGLVSAGTIKTILSLIVAFVYLFLLLMGITYAIDYFTLGFFKKIKWMARFYYPFYRFYNIITLSGLSRSIYYYLISKFSKKRIRIVYAFAGVLVLLSVIYSFDQYQYFPEKQNSSFISVNCYDDQRPEDDYVERASISSRYVDRPFFQLYLRYNPQDNELIRSQCPDFVPLKDDGLNRKLRLITQRGNLQITEKDFTLEDVDKLLDCQQSIYQISINDSIYNSLNYYFYIHPQKEQKGIITTISTERLNIGENQLIIRKINNDSTAFFDDYAHIPFWYHPN
ncbi:hypothetical protein [Ekhidna sp.]|uniref:hypothetical protein n=1 Tax=Ekhidna sp. TaxID=2608089 RepID=UPI003C7C106E